MSFFDLKTKSIILLIATLLTGLLAGVFFTWTNAITPGIGRLNDLGYLQAFQQMNRSILNPLFYVVFMGALLFSASAIYYYKFDSKYLFRLLSYATAIYFVGVFIVTLIGNLPLNDVLDKANLEAMSMTEIKNLRNHFELKWNNLHLIRTISSTTSFAFLILASLLTKNNI